MPWDEFLYTKHFGNTIYRPYADLVGDVSIEIDNLLGAEAEPAFARYFTPLGSRDLIFVYGQRSAVLMVSGSAYRHYPYRSGFKWAEFFQVTEESFIEAYPDAGVSACRIDQPELASRLKEHCNFVDPVIIGLPAVFIGERDSVGWQTRTRAVFATTQILLCNERDHYEKYLEMQKPKDIFLSHKSADKALVREVANTLAAIGFSPWLDEDKMKAGVNLERAIRKGFEDSCAAVFFVTPHFSDEGYLATEIDYALAEKREKGDRFSIITLLLSGANGAFGTVPKMLQPYVWKQVQPIEAIRTIVEALPIKMESCVWR